MEEKADGYDPYTDKEEWMYLDPVTKQISQTVAAALYSLFESELLPGETQVWKVGLGAWKSAFEVDKFKKVAKVSPDYYKVKWYYQARSGEQVGPIIDEDFLSLFESGAVDGMTLVWNQQLGEWKELSEIESLKSLMQNHKNLVSRKYQIGGEKEDEENDEVEDKEEVNDIENKGKRDNNNEKKKKNEKNKGDEKQKNTPLTFGGGVTTNTDKDKDNIEETKTKTEEEENNKDKPIKRKRNKKSKKSQWSESKLNTWVYIEGLPLDIKEKEIIEYFSKYGIINIDIDRNPKVKLYYDENKKFKGTASICYLKETSVDLCIQLCDKMPFDYQHKDNLLSVSKAVFQKKEDYVPKRNNGINKLKKVRKMQLEQSLSWNEEGVEDKGLKIVVLFNMFIPDDFKDKKFSNKLEQLINKEFGKYGHIDKITVFEKNEDGVVIVKYASSVAAEKCVKFRNGKTVGNRMIRCEFWDGVTNYQNSIDSDDSDEEKRLDKFGKIIEGDASGSDWSDDGSGSETE